MKKSTHATTAAMSLSGRIALVAGATRGAGRGIAPMGVRSNANVTQSQIAATIASLLGEDYNAAEPKAARPLTLR